MNKKLKAAITGLLIYLGEAKINESSSNWKKVGNSTIMKNRSVVQQRGKQIKNG